MAKPVDTRSPIARMIDAVVSCVKCGAKGTGTCDCWVMLRCPTCKRAKWTEREPGDGDVVYAMCPQCVELVKGSADDGKP